PVSCYDVVGYPGGAVRIYCVHQTNKTVNTYFCKMKPRTCTIPERVSVMNTRHYVAVDYRNLRLQDAGLYQCGDAGVWNHTVNLTVTQDPCCSGPKTVTGYLGETATISCSYPDQYKENFKNLQKQYDQYFTEVIDTEETQRDRFSISDDRRSKVVSVRIRDVKEDDGGVYYCGVWLGGESVSYYSLYSEIQLQVTAREVQSSGVQQKEMSVKPHIASFPEQCKCGLPPGQIRTIQQPLHCLESEGNHSAHQVNESLPSLMRCQEGNTSKFKCHGETNTSTLQDHVHSTNTIY
ncbi:hypothetical protein NFI96_008284, partial [Prochilodus magdalenae]